MSDFPAKYWSEREDLNLRPLVNWDPTYRKLNEVDDDAALPDYIGDTWEERIPERGTPEHKRYMRWANREGARDELRKSQ